MPTSDILRIVSVETVLPGVLKLAWDDGYKGVVDLREVIARGGVFEHIRSPENFRKVRLENYGHYIYWGEEGNEQVDFGCDRLRDGGGARRLAVACWDFIVHAYSGDC